MKHTVSNVIDAIDAIDAPVAPARAPVFPAGAEYLRPVVPQPQTAPMLLSSDVLRHRYDAILFALGGTLVEPHDLSDKSACNVYWIAGRPEALKQLNDAGIFVGMATNQSSVAFGIHTEDEVCCAIDRLLIMLADVSGADIDHWQVEFSHPNGTIPRLAYDSPRRKPGPEMLTEIRGIAKSQPGRTLFVGDKYADEEAARRDGCAYCDADVFFNDLKGAKRFRWTPHRTS